MKIARFATLSLVGMVVMGLVACSTTGPKQKMKSTALNANGKASSAQSYAMNDSAGFKARRGANGEIINSLVAPSEQTYYFNFDSNSVHSQDYQAIMAQANYLATHPNAKVRLEGNTDNRGSREYNIGLGWRRDQAVARLLEQQGVLAQQIDMVSYGKEKPAILGDNAHAWELNRRVHLVYERIQ